MQLLLHGLSSHCIKPPGKPSCSTPRTLRWGQSSSSSHVEMGMTEAFHSSCSGMFSCLPGAGMFAQTGGNGMGALEWVLGEKCPWPKRKPSAAMVSVDLGRAAKGEGDEEVPAQLQTLRSQGKPSALIPALWRFRCVKQTPVQCQQASMQENHWILSPWKIKKGE